MKILFVQPTSDKRGHYALWTSKICQAVASQGEEIVLLTNKTHSPPFEKEKSSFKIIEVKEGKYGFDRYDQAMERRSPLYWYGYFRNTYVILKSAFQLCRREKFDVVFITDVEYLTAALLLKRFGKHLPPVVWHVQAANFSYDSYCGSRFKKIYKVFQRKVFKKVLGKEVKGLVVLGEFHKKELRSQLDLDPSFPIDIVPDGAEENAHPLTQKEALEKIKCHYTGPVFLFFGMLRKDKGIEYLIEAVSLLRDQDFKVLIVGSLSEWTELELQNLIEQYQVGSHIELCLGYVPDDSVSSYYYASDVVVFPYHKSYTGGCGPLTKGASAHHKPVIVTDVSDLGRMVREYGNGFVAEACDAASFAQGMRSFLCLSAPEKEKWVQNATQLAKAHAWDIVAAKFIESLRETYA